MFTHLSKSRNGPIVKAARLHGGALRLLGCSRRGDECLVLRVGVCPAHAHDDDFGDMK